MNQTKIYAIFITAILLLWWPAWYFFVTQDMTLEIQEKDEKIVKALNTLKKAKSSIEKKDEKIKTQSWLIVACNEDLNKKNKELLSVKDALENAYLWISDDVISTESENLEIVKNEIENKNLAWETLEEIVKNVVENDWKTEDKNCPICEKCEINKIVQKSSWNSFDEKNELETMDLAYNNKLWKIWLPYVVWSSKTLLEMYNWEDEILSAKVWYYCGDDYLKDEYYWKEEKAIVRSYERAYCKDEKYENCSSEIKSKIDNLKDPKNILWSQVVRILTKYNDDFSIVNQEMFAVYNDFWKKICSWIRNTSDSWKKSYIQIR